MPGSAGTWRDACVRPVGAIADRRIQNVRDELKEGQQVLVKVINIDPTGKIRRSRKALLQEEGAPAGADRPTADTPA
jgi:polyribonucleotide nucleotidyltransferase